MPARPQMGLTGHGPLGILGQRDEETPDGTCPQRGGLLVSVGLIPSERELRRIARDAQDVSQLLGEMGLETELARKTLATNPQAADETLAAIWERLKLITTELDHYASELAPHALDEGNLLTALKQYVGHYHRCYRGSRELGLRGGDLRTSPQTATGLFRALQCLLRGVGNSDASHDVEVFLSIEGEEVVAEVAFQRIQPGLSSAGDPIGEMDERLRLIGGRSEHREDGDHILVICRAPIGPLPPAPRAMVIT